MIKLLSFWCSPIWTERVVVIHIELTHLIEVLEEALEEKLRVTGFELNKQQSEFTICARKLRGTLRKIRIGTT